MKDFIKRNIPVLVIGLVTVGVFLLIILAAQKNTTSGPKLEQIKKEQLVSSATPTAGPKDAKVVVVEFSDFECPACRQMHPIVSGLISKYKDRVLFAYKHFPLPQHPLAISAAKAAEAAKAQGKFWEFADKLFDQQPNFSKENYIAWAEELKLDTAQFAKDLDNQSLAQNIESDKALGLRIGIDATPSFIVNEKPVVMQNFEDLEKAIKEALVKAGLNADTSGTTESTQSSSSAETNSDDTTAQATNTDEAKIDAKYGFVRVNFTTLGFRPNNIKAIQGQKVIFTNQTKKPIKLEQVIYTYVVLNTPVQIDPGKSFSFRLSTEGIWTYKESSIKEYGSIYVVKPE